MFILSEGYWFNGEMSSKRAEVDEPKLPYWQYSIMLVQVKRLVKGSISPSCQSKKVNHEASFCLLFTTVVFDHPRLRIRGKDFLYQSYYILNIISQLIFC